MTTPRRYPPGLMATCPIPWNADLTFAEALFRDQLRLLIAGGYTDLYLFGTAGEGYAVDEEPFDAVVTAFHDEMSRAGLPGRVGIISAALRTIIGRIERCRAWGIRRFQISLPFWGTLSDAEVAVFFRETCGRFPDCEFMHYNLMRAGRLLSPGEYHRLAEVHPNLVATKQGGLDSVGGVERLLRGAPRLQHFLGEQGFAYGSLIDECGLLISVASSQLAAGQAYFAAGRTRDAETLLSMQRELSELTSCLHALMGDTAHMDGAYDKLFCRLHDPRFPLRLLPPYAGASETVFQEYVSLLRRQFPRWIESGTAETHAP